MKSWPSLVLLVALWAVVLHLLLTPELVAPDATSATASSAAAAICVPLSFLVNSRQIIASR